jgi:hypothetical protein
MLGDHVASDDLAPNKALMHTLLGRDEEHVRSLGEYDFANYPDDLREILRRREEVVHELVRLDLTSRTGRIAAIPHLSELLRHYPHPLAYEALIMAYLDADRWDEANGLAFSARQRRLECARSEYAEIRAEIQGLREWTTEDLEGYWSQGGRH